MFWVFRNKKDKDGIENPQQTPAVDTSHCPPILDSPHVKDSKVTEEGKISYITYSTFLFYLFSTLLDSLYGDFIYMMLAQEKIKRSTRREKMLRKMMITHFTFHMLGYMEKFMILIVIIHR